jgi:hypothetical protein
MTLDSQSTLFLSHSHKDQLAAYAISEWICQLWPDLHLFVTHKGLSGREQIEQHSYLKVLPHVEALVCLLSEDSMTSNAVFDELDVALQLSKPIIQVMQPNATDDDRRVYSYLQSHWEPKYGGVIHPDTVSGEEAFLDALCSALNRQSPDTWSTGMLMRLVAKKRTQPPSGSSSLPNVQRLETGLGTWTEAIEWLAHLELEHDNQMRIRGLPTVDLSESNQLSIEARVARLLFTVQPSLWPQPIRQLRPLIDIRLKRWLLQFANNTPDWKDGATALRLLRIIDEALGS